MARRMLLRLLGLLPMLFGITFLSFLLLHLAGSDPVLQKMEQTGQVVSQAVLDQARADLGLDQPLLVQYAQWLGGLLQGDLGTSYLSGQPVLPTLLAKLPATLALAAGALALTVAISFPLGILAAVYKDSWLDRLIRLVTFVGNSMPNFFVALLLLLVFAVRLKWLPVLSNQAGWAGGLLPAVTLAIAMSAKYIRQVRAAVLSELGKGYVMGALARGVPFFRILTASVLRSALVPLVTLLTLSLGSLLGGTAIVESIFLWDGVGKLAVDAIQMRDYPVVQAYVLWMALLYAFLRLGTDLLEPVLDPRVRRTTGEGEML